MNSRKTRLILAVAIAAAIFGYKALRPEHGSQHAATTANASAAPVAPIAPVLLGKIAFTPCSLSSPQAKDSLEAMCATYAVPENRAMIHPSSK